MQISHHGLIVWELLRDMSVLSIRLIYIIFSILIQKLNNEYYKEEDNFIFLFSLFQKSLGSFILETSNPTLTPQAQLFERFRLLSEPPPKPVGKT